MENRYHRIESARQGLTRKVEKREYGTKNLLEKQEEKVGKSKSRYWAK
jgi:hypothetical protein